MFGDAYACERCGRRDGLDAVAPNEVWETIREGYNLLCLWCMDELAVKHGVRCSVTLHFAGQALFGDSQSDADKEHIDRLVEQREKALSALEPFAQSYEGMETYSDESSVDIVVSAGELRRAYEAYYRDGKGKWC
jgi:hypothetical protein